MAKEKTTGIYFKVSDKERQLIEQRMEDAGVSNMSAFIRKMCLNRLIVRLDIPQIPDCSKYLKSASNNLNQIARRLNSGGGYLQYKKLPQKKQAEFYEAHRSDILLHEVAKRYFDSLGLAKLPSIKALKQVYAVLAAENKRLYPDQKEARKKMIDLLTAKSDVERFLEVKIELPDRKEQQESR